MHTTGVRATRLALVLTCSVTVGVGLAGGSGSAGALAREAETSVALPLPPPAHGARPSSAAVDATFSYHYAAAETQMLGAPYAQGASATFTVERPIQVSNGHSLAELALESPAMDYSYIEAGWIVTHKDAPRLFIFWWDQGTPKCYNQGCGYVQDGGGIQPGARLQVGSAITLTWQHQDGNWWLLVNGEPSGYYPDSQWTGSFTDTGFGQVFGEVAIKDGTQPCHDMGDGLGGGRRNAASITGVAFIDGPAMALVPDVDEPANHYTLGLTGPDSTRYGGPGIC